MSAWRAAWLLKPGDFLVGERDTVADVKRTGDGRIVATLTNDGEKVYFKAYQGMWVA